VERCSRQPVCQVSGTVHLSVEGDKETVPLLEYLNRPRNHYTTRMQASARPWVFNPLSTHIPLVDASVSSRYLAEESETVRLLLDHARLDRQETQRVTALAVKLVKAMRRNRQSAGGLDAFMSEYDLSSAEGTVLMCLAEALLRIPDAETADRLIADKLGDADWQAHFGTSDSVFVNASTWALMLTGRLLNEDLERGGLGPYLTRAVGRLGEPVIRTALRQAMRILGHQFVMGRTIEEALQRSGESGASAPYRYSFDMLGEAALTARDAERYLVAYTDAIPAVGVGVEPGGDLMEAPSISVKLSALSPRFEFAQGDWALAELSARLLHLALIARDCNVALTVDAEEADRLELTLAVFKDVLSHKSLRDWSGLGIAVQAYQKRGYFVVEWLEELAHSLGRVIAVRLVKGAYWDTEIKRAQEQGLDEYPVFTRKSNTDVSYLACAKALLKASPHLYPQFATHNAHTIAWIMHAGAKELFEFQRLHGMGEEVYSEVVGSGKLDRPCRVYAPVGSHEDLLPYLVRRLLENGANTSFVNRFVQEEVAAETIVEDPLEFTDQLDGDLRHPAIPLPTDLFGESRRNSQGLNLSDVHVLDRLSKSLGTAIPEALTVTPIVDGRDIDGEVMPSHDPADWSHVVGSVKLASPRAAREALEIAHAEQPAWNLVPPDERGSVLRAAADLFERQRGELVALCVREAGRTVADSVAEVREAVDFLRYYATEGERLFAGPTALHGATGERNELRLQGRGVFLCISPWNFPLAIFTGQIAAALAAGNTVLAKPAEATSLVARRAVDLLLEAGVPSQMLHYLPGEGSTIAGALLPDSRLAGVAFTGSTATARKINRGLAERDGPLATLIAETGGVNAMIVDSSALPEQVVRDAVQSAFNSAGQRCSALRLLCLQEDTADAVLEMLVGNMAELVIGDPALLRTQVGPVIDQHAQQQLQDYAAIVDDRIRYQCPLSLEHESGVFVAPTLVELKRATELTREVFGPFLHVVRYAAASVDELIDDINSTGYGLTLGIHSRVDSFAAHITDRVRVGNVYVNRNMIGAQVGVQPFGGVGLSGTGPKAGGPHYLTRFATEQTISTNTAAVGGNATLLSLGESS